MINKEAEKDSRVLVSACLAGVNCRMDGGNKLIPEIKALVDAGKAVPVCPEVLGGLPTPRAPSEIRNGRVYSRTGQDVTDEFTAGARASLEICAANGCTLAILKSKSPSCGCGIIHNGLFDGGLTPGNGIFSEMLLSAGVRVQTEADYLNSRQEALPENGIPDTVHGEGAAP